MVRLCCLLDILLWLCLRLEGWCSLLGLRIEDDVILSLVVGLARRLLHRGLADVVSRSSGAAATRPLEFCDLPGTTRLVSLEQEYLSRPPC